MTSPPAPGAPGSTEPSVDLDPPTVSGLPERPAIVVRPGVFVTAVILSCVAAGVAIYWLLRSMRI